MQKAVFIISGMSCAACAARINKAVAALNSAFNVNVNLLKNTLTLDRNEALLSDKQICQAVENLGYQATPLSSDQTILNTKKTDDQLNIDILNLRKRLWISIIFTLPLFYLAMTPMIHAPLPPFFIGEKNILFFAITQLILTIPIILTNLNYFVVGFKTLIARSPNMDSLIAIGSGSATLYSLYSIYNMLVAFNTTNVNLTQSSEHDLYFDSAAMILCLITLGKYLELKAKGKTSQAISKLVNLAPKTAIKLDDNQEKTIPIDQVNINDILVVKAGSLLPTDGIIIEGQGYIDESAITGESLPLEKQKNDKVTGGTLLNSGHILMKATRIGNDTTLAQIIKLVNEAASSKATIARIADKISLVFVPVVIAIALIATLVWLLVGYSFGFALSIGISVLVISCPCALGLATPTAIMVGIGKGASHGILFKSAASLETIGNVNTIVFDKTGTITQGKPIVTDVITSPSTNITDLLTIAASLEHLSEHPIAKAIMLLAKNNDISPLKVSEFKQVFGQGIKGVINDVECLAGNAKMLKQFKIENPFTEQLKTLTMNGKTVLYFTKNHQLLGLIAIADTIKATSPQAVSEISQLGLNVIMLTGDNLQTAKAIAHQANIQHVIADVLPQEKDNEIRQLQQQNKMVAMVGDGINDAPALARANVGIAIGAGTDVAIESADIVLMKSDILDVSTAIQLSQAVIRNIKENLFWAFCYNLAGIPIAAGLFYASFGLTLNPMIAAAAMSLSSVSVVLNALRLRFFKAKHISLSTNQQGESRANHKQFTVINRNPTTSQSITNKKSNLVSNPLSKLTTKIKTTQQSSLMMDNKMSNLVTNSQTKIIHIQGMSCSHCIARIEKALKALPGVRQVKIDLANNIATVKVIDTSDSELENTITKAGYQVVDIKQQ